jgi:hypothetical protein
MPAEFFFFFFIVELTYMWPSKRSFHDPNYKYFKLSDSHLANTSRVDILCVKLTTDAKCGRCA